MPVLLPFAVRPVHLAVAALCTATVGSSADVISRGGMSVDVNDFGLLIGLPSGPVETVDGPTMVFDPRGCVEWWGVQFESPDGRVEGCGAGTARDWGDRTPAEPVSADFGPDWARTVNRVGDMEVETYIRFQDDELSPLVATVTLTNRGASPLRMIFFTRESRPFGPVTTGWSFPTDLRGMLRPSPDPIQRSIWMPDDLRPGAAGGMTFSYRPKKTDSRGPDAVDVPLVLWTGPGYGSGLPVGATNGISWGDYDQDGWIDIFACQSANLWRSVGGTTWELAADLSSIIPDSPYRYGAPFGDYNNDGLLDLMTEPRACCGGDTCVHLLKNLGGSAFVNLGSDPDIIDRQPCGADCETILWGDVDGDENLDAFIPVYPAWVGGPGNFFLYNLGPTGPGGEYRFTEISAAAGLDNPAGTARPEGAMLFDADLDGDADIYSNGTLYQNHSTPGHATFTPMKEGASGIGLSGSLEEGATFADYDLDGDNDCLVVYTSEGVKIWDAYGDGMYYASDTVIDSPFTGLNLGLSAEDWDNDGDIDFSTREVFRRNQFAETGARKFTVATHSIPSGHLTSATPAWGDWDKDGDLDCALGNWLDVGHFYHNTTYGESTPRDQRRYVRVRCLRDSDAVPIGLETEYGTNVELVVTGDTPGRRRTKVVSSANGYLNQNEYTLHFALPSDPKPEDPTEDVHFDVIADFPSVLGVYRVDKHVNSALGDVNLAALEGREIIVFRSGIVRIDGAEHSPSGSEKPLLTTAAGGLAQATGTSPLPAPTTAASSNVFVGIDFDTIGASSPVRIREIIIDGELGLVSGCGGADLFRLALWDVTETVPESVAKWNAAPQTRNRRQYITVDQLLEKDRHYRLVARVAKHRATAISGPIDEGNLLVRGGLLFEDASPCTGTAAAAASADSSKVYLTLRYGAVSTCRPDCTGDGKLNVNDFICFQSEWQRKTEYGDYNGDGVWNINDFIAFQADFRKGCP